MCVHVCVCVCANCFDSLDQNACFSDGYSSQCMYVCAYIYSQKGDNFRFNFG